MRWNELEAVLRSRSRQFWGGSGAGVDFLVGRSQEPEPLFYGGSGSCWIFEKKLYLVTGMLLYVYEISYGHKRTAEVTEEMLRSHEDG